MSRKTSRGSAVGGRHGQAQRVRETCLALGGAHVAGVIQQVVGDGQDRQCLLVVLGGDPVEGGCLHLHSQDPVPCQRLGLPLGVK